MKKEIKEKKYIGTLRTFFVFTPLLLSFLALNALVVIVLNLQSQVSNASLISLLVLSLIIYIVLAYFTWKRFIVAYFIGVLLFTSDLIMQISMGNLAIIKNITLISLLMGLIYLWKTKK